MPPYVRADGDRNLLATLEHRSNRHDVASPSGSEGVRSGTGLRRGMARDHARPADGDRPGVARLARHVRAAPVRQHGAPFRDRRCSSARPGASSTVCSIARESNPGLVNRMVGGTGDIDSAQLAQRLWTLGRLVADDASLTAAFDAGLDGIAERTEASALRPALDAFLADHGHRCSDEYELAVPGMGHGPGAGLRGHRPTAERAGRARPCRRGPTAGRRCRRGTRRGAAPACRGPLRPFLRRCAQVSRLGSIARERAKDILVLENLGARRVLAELVRRAAERGGPQRPLRSPSA